MCGIAGALDLTGSREFPLRQLLAMTDSIAHRGPDDEHFYTKPGIAMGVRRLAIMDIVNGRQPISNQAENIWTAFNGQIFNYSDIRQDLLIRGHHLKTQCDSEAWAYLYEDHGEGMFERTQGQFAVSLWDSTTRTLLLGRDRMGICPLYYAERDGWLIWGSEIKALLASGLVQAQPDRKGIDYLFNFFCAPTNRTFFDGIKLIPAGHFLRVKNGRCEIRQYWDLDFPDAGEERREHNPQILIDEFGGLLNKAVKQRLRGDVPVVSYLSSGIDSTMILDISSRQNGSPIPSFTIGMNKNVGPDERIFSDESAALIGSKITTLSMDSIKIANAIPELIMASEGPVLDTSCAALMQLAAEVNNQGYKVVLTGEGADEALAGYVWFKTHKLSGKITDWIGPTLSQLLCKLTHATVHRKPQRCQTIPFQAIGGIRPAQQYMYEMVGMARETVYSDGMWASLEGHDSYSDLNISHERIKRWHPLNQSLYVGYKVMLAGLLMIAKGDRIAMRSAVESRYPYLDEDVTNFCASIDPSYKLYGMTEKWILRQLAAKTLPSKIVNRRKTMFRSILSDIFLGPQRPAWVDQLLSPESLQRAGYFDPEVVARERKRQVSFPRLTPRQYIFDAVLTCVVSTQLWHHLFFGGGLCELPTNQGHPI